MVCVPGSNQSLSLIDTLLSAKDEIFDTKVTLLIEEKWVRVQAEIIRSNFIYFFYMSMITCLVLMENDKHILFLKAIMCYQTLLLSLEAREMIKYGVSNYFQDVTNWFDLIQGFCLMLFGFQQIKANLSTEDPKPRVMIYLLYIAVLLGYWKCLTLIQVFGQSIRTNVIMF